jgi:class 3 adenylate cyclase
MTEPRIQYAKTSDGVSIAFWAMGEGKPLIHMPLPFSHIQLEWEYPEYRSWYEPLAARTTLVRYDLRGTGMSDRERIDFSLDAGVADLQAVADCLRLERFALFGLTHTAPTAIAYAARYPERVSHLILWCGYAQGAEWARSPQVQATRGLIDKDWATYTETVAHILLGWAEGEPARRVAALIREAVTPDVLKALIAATLDFDVRRLLPDVKAPTLVLHRRQVPFLTVSAARGLASGIPDARLLLFEGESGVPSLGNTEAVVAAIDEFLSEGEETGPKTELPEGMAVILFADIVESTSLTEKLGDAAFREKARELDASLRAIIRECSGTPVEGKLVGDGVLAVFTSARQAIECALRCNAASEPVGLQLHIGIHAGDVIREGNNVFGGAVNIAARIAGASAPGEVLVSDTVRGLARTSAGVAFDDRGEHTLKGVGDPQRLFAVRGSADG